MDKNQIIVDHRNGKSNRTIAKELGVSKNTVNDCPNPPAMLGRIE